MNASLCHVPLDAELSFLNQPGSYPEPTRRVQAIETHMSWVFLTDHYAYKLKKPIRYGPIDARLTAMRHFYCVEEVRLNRRLAGDIYLAALPLVLGQDGHLEFVGEGATVDWLVKMRRLPHEDMLDDAIASKRADGQDMDRVAQLLAGFHGRCRKVTPRPQPFSARILSDLVRHEAELLTPEYGLDTALVRAVCAAQREALEQLAETLDVRHAAGRVVEGHGDLRAEHVYLGEPTAIIDCLEFSRALRTLDVLDEAGFLALECERLGAAELGDAFLEHYARHSGEDTDGPLRHFFQSVRAATRATIAIRHLGEPRYRFSRHWQDRAMAYLALAQRHVPH